MPNETTCAPPPEQADNPRPGQWASFRAIDATLAVVRETVLANVQADLLDEHSDWIYLPLLRLRTAQWGCVNVSRAEWGNLLPGATFDRRLLLKAQEFIGPLAESPGCRSIKRGNRWTNPGFCPPTPFGDYIWSFTVWMVQEIVWLREEFVEGYDWWLSPNDRGRGDNPYASGDDSDSWDKGYILGHAGHFHPDRIRRWMDALAKEAT